MICARKYRKVVFTRNSFKHFFALSLMLNAKNKSFKLKVKRFEKKQINSLKKEQKSEENNKTDINIKESFYL